MACGQPAAQQSAAGLHTGRGCLPPCGSATAPTMLANNMLVTNIGRRMQLPATVSPTGRYATMTLVTESGLDWRQRKKAATRDRIRASALRLFREQGYDATTVEQIAAAAGVSHVTFFRYFPTKEDVALSDSYDPLIASFIAQTP